MRHLVYFSSLGYPVVVKLWLALLLGLGKYFNKPIIILLCSLRTNETSQLSCQRCVEITHLDVLSNTPTILAKIHSNICVQTMVIVQIHKIVVEKRHLPLPTDQCWFEKWNANLTWHKWSSTLINIEWGRGWFSTYKKKFVVQINFAPVVPVILARIGVCLSIHQCLKWINWMSAITPTKSTMTPSWLY